MSADIIRVYIGYDGVESVAWSVFAHSLIEKSSKPLQISPIALDNLKDIFKRERNPLQSTEFSFSRFLMPYLANYEGWAIFVDCDFLALDDIAKLWDMRDDRYAVMCVKHDHKPAENVKFLGATQTTYEKKNWSSMMMMNCAKCTALTPDYVNTATGLELHRFQWLESDDLIGEVPPAWNHLVGYNKAPVEEISMLHYTEGGPYFEDYRDCEHADVWLQARDRMLKTG